MLRYESVIKLAMGEHGKTMGSGLCRERKERRGRSVVIRVMIMDCDGLGEQRTE